MSHLTVHLFGKFSVECAGQIPVALDALRAQELFSYLLLHRDRPYPRETLASLLWGDSSPSQAKKLMRQGLWQLQAALETVRAPAAAPVVLVGPTWIQINPQADLWIDTMLFEAAHVACHGLQGREWEVEKARAVQQAVELYQGELLEGWYQEWCLVERERLQSIYLGMLDKLMDYCETHGEFDWGLIYGARILAYDPARERTHRRLMRMHYLNGDRTAALRQYQRCVTAMADELGIPPARRTVLLYEQIRADVLESARPSLAASTHLAEILPRPASNLQQLQQLKAILASLQREVDQEIQGLESGFRISPI